eukprot:c18774_g2_i1.p1 GENE.c18774_g2_i1~~c18774_g2_i1.p1  ORF type:complete len:159 (+),score=0.73 c18774_g2_i1:29-478(+)
MTKFMILVIFSLIFVLHVFCDDLFRIGNKCYILQGEKYYDLKTNCPKCSETLCGAYQKIVSALTPAYTTLLSEIAKSAPDLNPITDITNLESEYICQFTNPDIKCCKSENQGFWAKSKGQGDSPDNGTLREGTGGSLESLIEKLIEDLK